MNVSAVAFGKITILDPQTTHALATELRAVSTSRNQYAETPVLDKVRGRRTERSSNDDPRLIKDSFSPRSRSYGSASGVFPSFDQYSRAGLFPLRDGWGAVVTNDGAHVKDLSTGSGAPHKYDDLNSLLFTFHRDPEGFSDPAAVVSKFVASERGLQHKPDRSLPEQSGPIVQLDLRA
ncbi:MAG: hypothetical protein KC474_04740 [Cyanobacteria bacterium HKST-UBA04]|nr:hypothetical protein [Cyanobacteria bacterium HKST-UBA04]